MALQTMERSGSLPQLRVNSRHCPASALPATGRAEFEASAPKGYFETLGELIERHPKSPPADFRIFDVQDEDKRPLYGQATLLCSVLSEIAAVPSNKGCVIFASDKLEIAFSYREDDLKAIPEIELVANLMTPPESNDPDPARLFEIHRTLFRQALYDVLASVAKDKRFAHLIQHFDESLFRYRLAFNRFSKEANLVIERYEEKRAGMITALNGVLGNIQTSLIGIPLAGLLALKELKLTDGLSFGNLVIIIASLTVSVLLFLLTLSQRKTLEAVALQYQQLKKEIDDSGGGKTKISSALISMNSHQRLVGTLLKMVQCIIVAFSTVAIATIVALWGQ